MKNKRISPKRKMHRRVFEGIHDHPVCHPNERIPSAVLTYIDAEVTCLRCLRIMSHYDHDAICNTYGK